MTRLKLALRKLGMGMIVLQWFGNLVVILLAFAWLQIPDSHAWQFVFSLFSSVVLVFAFLGLHTHTFQKLRGTQATSAWWLRLLVLLAVIVFSYLVLQLIGIGRSHETLYAGYWNSKFSTGLRAFFTFQRLVEWQDHIYDLLRWLVVALLLPIAFVGAGTGLRGCLALIRSIYRHVVYWLVVVLLGFAGAYVSSLLAGWTPSHGTAIEILSVVLRLGAAYTLDILLWCYLLALMATYSDNEGPNVTEQ